MTLFTNNPFEKMMIQKPDYGKREKSLSPCLCFLPLQGTVPLCGVLSETGTGEKENRAGTLKGGTYI